MLRAAEVTSASLSLLDPSPFDRADERTLREALLFAFATGDAGDTLDRAIDQMPLAESSWQPEDFARDVFLQEVLDRCLTVQVDGKGAQRCGSLLFRILSAPPLERAVVQFRQNIFTELLARPGLRDSLEDMYGKLSQLRSLLAKTGALRIDPLERRLSILRLVRDVVALACEGFVGATSGLGRVATWGAWAASHPAYGRLKELLAYEECTAEVDVRLRLGIDGRIRDFAVLARREPVDNPFHHTPGRKFLAKARLLWQGYRWSDHELLARLTDDVFEGLVEVLPGLLPFTGDLEFYLSGMSFRDGAMRAGFAVSLATFTRDGSLKDGVNRGAGHMLGGLFNPLLLSEGARAVSCDIAIAGSGARVVVTGPNSGGKTRLLQSSALAQILGQAGMFVPARSARLPWASGLFVSLIEHTRADQSEGRLGTELVRIRRLFENLQAGSLVILDELCSGTNPSEGEDIFRLVVKLLGELRPSAFITTHFLAFAARLAKENEDLTFLQVELDGAERPTYQFVSGVATTSLAHKTAERLGVTEDALRAAINARNPRGGAR